MTDQGRSALAERLDFLPEEWRQETALRILHPHGLFIADASTLAGGNVIAVGALGTPQAVASAGITLSVTALTISLT